MSFFLWLGAVNETEGDRHIEDVVGSRRREREKVCACACKREGNKESDREVDIPKKWAFEFTLIIIDRTFLTQGSENMKLYTGWIFKTFRCTTPSSVEYD